jgi:hypothetical protein
LEKLTRRDYTGDTGVGDRIILKCMLINTVNLRTAFTELKKTVLMNTVMNANVS